jgi:pimeloyl-ACP methyl ester carboxylesterase
VAGYRVRELGSEGPHPPVVFVHGLGVSTLYLRPALRTFARERAVLALDLPGFGKSDDPPEPLGVPELAAFLATWLDRAQVGPVPVVANSMGCQVAVEMAAVRPNLVSALVLVGPTADPSARSVPELVGRLAVDSVREPLALSAGVAFDYLVRAGPLRTLATARLMFEHRIDERAARVPVPVLVVRGQRDPIAPREWCARLAGLFPLGDLTEINGAAHAAHFSHPVSLLEAARPLLAGFQAAPTGRPHRQDRPSV